MFFNYQHADNELQKKNTGKKTESNFEIEATRVFTPLEPLLVHVGHCQCKQDLVKNMFF